MRLDGRSAYEGRDFLCLRLNLAPKRGGRLRLILWRVLLLWSCQLGRFCCRGLMFHSGFQLGEGAIRHFDTLISLLLEPVEFVDQSVQCFAHALLLSLGGGRLLCELAFGAIDQPADVGAVADGDE